MNTLRAKWPALLGAGLLTVVLTVFAASMSSGAPGKATITVWAWAEAADTITTKAKADFEAANPDITVNLVKMAPWDLVDKFFASLVSGGPVPDVAEMIRRVYPKFMGTGQMLDVTNRAAPYVSGFTKGSLAEVTNKGKIYGMPTETSYSVFVYNKKIFAEHGIDPKTLVTWDDVKRAGEVLNQSGIKICTQNIPTTGAPGVMLWNMFNIAARGNIYRPDGAVVQNNAKAAQLFDWYYGMRDVCFQSASHSPDMVQALKQHKIAGVWGDTPEAGFVKNQVPEQAGEWAILPWPQFDASGPKVVGRWGGSAFTIPARAANPQAAWKFIEFMTTNDTGIRNMWKVGSLITSYTPAWKQPYFREGDPYYSGQIALDVLNGYELAPPYYWGYNWLQTQDIIGAALDDMFAGRTTPADAWNRVEQKLRAVAP